MESDDNEQSQRQGLLKNKPQQIGQIGKIKKLNHLTIKVEEKSMDQQSVSNLASSIMDADRAIEGKNIGGFVSPKIESVDPNKNELDMRKISYATDKDGLMNIAAMQLLALQKKKLLDSADIDATKSRFSYNGSLFLAAQARYQQAVQGQKTTRNTNNTAYDALDKDNDLMMTVVDVDIEEIDDRVEMLKETIESLEQNQQTKNLEMFKINLTSLCTEKAIILSLIYKFKTVRAVRDEAPKMKQLEDHMRETDRLRDLSIKIAEQMGQLNFFNQQESEQNDIHNLKELEKKSHLINEAFDILKTSRLDPNGREITFKRQKPKKMQFEFGDINSERGSDNLKRSQGGPGPELENQSLGAFQSFPKPSDLMSVTKDQKDKTPMHNIDFADKLERDEKSDNNRQGKTSFDIDEKDDIKNKKCVKISAAVGVLLLIVTVIIILTAKKGGGDDPGPDPGPGPGPGPDPPISGGYNPYKIAQSFSDQKEIRGFLQADTQTGWTEAQRSSFLRQISPNDVGILDPRVILQGENNQIISNVSFVLGTAKNKCTYVWLDDAENPRFSIPEEALPKPNEAQATGMRNDMNGMTVSTDGAFSFKFTDNRDQSNVFVSTEGGNFIMMDKYIQLDLNLPSRRIYGLGERNRNFTLVEGTWTMWANGQETPFDNGTGGLQTYGVHPFALVQTAKPGEFFGIFFRNANAQSPVLKYTDDNKSTLSYITTGGALEIYFFWKGNAKQIIQQYQQMFGKPVLPPLWALGWHSSSASYKNLDMIKANVEAYNNASIPLEGVWLDIPYMSDDDDFTVNQTSFAGLKQYTEEIQNEGKRMVVAVDSGLSVDGSYFIDASQTGALIQSSINPDDFNGALTAKVNSKKTAFLDLWSDNAKKIWSQGLKNLYENDVAFDGLWLNMNEPTIDCNGECPDGNKNDGLDHLQDNELWYQSLGDQSNNSTYDLPFIPGPIWNLDNTTLSLNSTHPTGDSAVSGMRQFDTHSLNGHIEAKATREFLLSESSNRTFILSRSTFAGSGQYTQHWLGDNHRTWDDMRTSIAAVMNFNMFGIPFVGPDTCGYYGQNVNITQDLCTRWIQLASFYPFARQNRADKGGGDENAPYAMDKTYEQIAKAALQDRLQYSRHLYSCLYATQQEGGTCFDPLIFHFPTDDQTFLIDQTEHSFIFANALKVTPILDKQTSDGSSISSYFPKGTWVSMNDYSDLIVSEGGEDGWKKLSVSWDPTNKINTHLMPGAIVTKQEGSYLTTRDIQAGKDAPYTFIANRDENGAAAMKLYLDDGISLNQQTEFYEFQLSANSLKKWKIEVDEESKRGFLDKLVITNAQDLNATNFACMTTGNNWTHVPLKYNFDEDNKTLTISSQSGDAIMLNEMRDIHFGNDEKETNMCNLENQYKLRNPSTIDLTGHNTSITLTSDQKSLQDLTLNLTLFKATTNDQPIINIKWSFANQTTHKKPFEVPKEIVGGPSNGEATDLKLNDYIAISYTNTSMSVRIRRNGQDVYSLNSMILDEYFNFISAVAHTMPNARVGPMGILGLYERTGDELYLQDGVYSLWSLDTPNPVETRTAPGQQEYGTHPFYMGRARDSSWFGVYTNLAAAQDWWIANNAATGDVTVRTVAAGGLGDIFIILGKNPNEVSQIYQEIVGLPVLPPQWALGWNQCKWGYLNTDELEWVVDNYTSHDLPQDVQWSDIDWLDRYRDFTFDQVNFEYLPSFIEKLHNQSQHYIPIIDAGIAQRPNQDYPAYDDGVQRDIFIKTGDGQEILTGEVWPAEAAFPDFFNPDTPTWWQSWLSHLYESIKFDGLWLDMNEASNFCNGVCYDSQRAQSPVFNQLPYVPTGRNLELKSMPLDALHYGDVNELDAHSLFGTMEVKATHDWFESQDKRTMIIERSAFSGLGKYGSRWLGDNYSNETYMGYSVTGIMAHNIIGIPFAGSDICGFLGDTTPELCARWHTVGAFYPFSRNHNTWGSKPQEPYQFVKDVYEGTISYFDIMQRAIFVKYSMVRYYYTQLYLVHKLGGTFYKPLFFVFPDDPSAYLDQPFNIMLGDGLKLGVNSAILGLNETNFLFPKGTWCDIYNTKNKCITNEDETSIQVLLPCKAYDFHLHLRDGFIVPMQNAKSVLQPITSQVTKTQNPMTTADLQSAPVEFHINPGLSQNSTVYEASGDYINDDGVTLKNSNGTNSYTLNYYQNATSDSDIVINFYHYEKAENYKSNNYTVNENDVFGAIYIYNAEAQGNNQSFGLYITTRDGQDCGQYPINYDPASDRLGTSPDQSYQKYCLELPNIEKMVFKKIEEKQQ